MNKTTFFILLTAAIFILASCEKCYLYRDKWLGKYQCTIRNINYIQERHRSLKVSKDDDNGIFITDGSNCNIRAVVLKDGTIHTDSIPSFSGSFIGRDSLTLTYHFTGYGEGRGWDYFYCKKSK